jgi:hypothetical protein
MQLDPVIRETFDMPSMVRLSVGPSSVTEPIYDGGV